MPITAASIARLKRGHEDALAEVKQAIEEELRFGGQHAENFVHQHPGFKPRSGRLQAATKTKVVRTRGGKLLRITNDKKYAAAIDGGAKPHPISPKGGGYLHFKGKNGWVRTKKTINHPGNRPYKFLYRAFRSAARVVEPNLHDRLSRIASRF